MTLLLQRPHLAIQKTLKWKYCLGIFRFAVPTRWKWWLMMIWWMLRGYVLNEAAEKQSGFPSSSLLLLVLIIQDPGEGEASHLISGPLCLLSACRSCLPSLFLLAIFAEHKGIAAFDWALGDARGFIYYGQNISYGHGRRSRSALC